MPEDLSKSKAQLDCGGLDNQTSEARVRIPKLRHLADSSLTTGARITFAALCESANANKSMWPSDVPQCIVGFLAWPSVPTIARITGLSKRGTQAALKELELANAITCVYHSKGGGGRGIPRTNCYLLTPQSLRGKNTEPRSEATRTGNRAADHHAVIAPNHFIHHSGNLTIDEVSSEKVPKAKSIDVVVGSGFLSPESELRLRMETRHNDHSGGLAHLVLRLLKSNPVRLVAFLKYDELRTTAPDRIQNPGGYYRNLVKEFLQREQSRENFKANESRNATRKPCTLGKCDGSGQIYSDDRVTACECEVGARFARLRP